MKPKAKMEEMEKRAYDLLKVIQVVVNKYEGCKLTTKGGKVKIYCPKETRVVCASELATLLGSDCISQGSKDE